MSIAATASDNVKVAKVEFYVNNVILCSDLTSPYSCSWSVPNIRNVTYSLKAKAYDTSNNSTVSSTVKTTSK